MEITGGDLVVLTTLALTVFGIVRKMLRDRKDCKGCCSGCCGSCQKSKCTDRYDAAKQ